MQYPERGQAEVNLRDEVAHDTHRSAVFRSHTPFFRRDRLG
jgi:hypothetical protein